MLSCKTVLYFSLNRSMDFCISARKSFRRCRRVTNHVTTEPTKPLGRAKVNNCSQMLSIVPLCLIVVYARAIIAAIEAIVSAYLAGLAVQ